MKNIHHNMIFRPLEKALITFFVLAALSLVIVYIIDPSIYLETLKLQPAPADRYSPVATLFLVAILGFIAFVITGVLRHWRWLFWLILVAFGAAILDIPTTILQLTGVISGAPPLWYSLYRMGVACIQMGIFVWMVRTWRRDGVWGMGKRRNAGEQANLTSQQTTATMEAQKEEDSMIS